MSEDSVNIRGIGKVITSADVFGDFDEVASGRLADRAEPAPEPDDDDYADYNPPVVETRGWSDKPSIANQASKAPATVRFGAPVTTSLNLSVAEELQSLNDLQAKAYALDGPFAVIHHIDKKFHEGQWFALVTHSQISYQKL